MKPPLKLDYLIKPIADVAFVFDRNFRYQNYWTSDPKYLFVSPDQFMNKTIDEVLGDKFAEIVIPLFIRVFDTGIPEVLEYKSMDGTKWYRAIINTIDIEDQSDQYISVLSKDITEEKNILTKNRIFENIITNNWDAVVFANMEGNVEYINPAANKLYGYEEDELIGKNVDVFNSQKSHNTADIVKAIINDGHWTGEIIQLRKDGSIFDALLSVQLILDENQNPLGYASFSKDISNQLETAKKFKELISEKDELLRELHHRVKNNLAIIRGLIKLKFDKIRDPFDIRLIKDYVNRIDALGMITNKMYLQDNLNQINFKEFIDDLKYSIYHAYDVATPIEFKYELEKCKIPFSKAIPLGLIMNEVISNSIKHAFNENEEAWIKVKLKRDEKNIILTIEDNGIGFDYDATKNESFGLDIIEGLVDQIDGEFYFHENNGTIFTLKLQENKL